MTKTNKRVRKNSLKREHIYIIVWIVIIGMAVGFSILGFVEKYKDVEFVHLNELIILEDNNTYKNAFIDVSYKPYVFAEYDEDATKFYIVQDAEYMYIAYLTEEVYKTIIDLNLEKEPYPIKGYTKTIPEDVRLLAIEAYNEAVEEEIVTESNFESYFGSIYIDTTKVYNNSEFWFALATILGVLGTFALANVTKKKKLRGKYDK